MAHFAAAHNAALKDLAVQNDTAADTAAERKHDDIGIVLAGSRYSLAESSTVRVIGDAHGAGNDPSENLHKIDVVPAQVVGVEDLPLPPVDGARHSHADADALVQRNILLFQKIQCALRHFINKRFRFLFRIGCEGALCDDLIPVIHKTDLRLGASDGDTHTNGACFLPDRCEQGIALSFDLPVPAACRQEEAVSLAIGHGLSFAADHTFAVQDQNAQEGGLVHRSLHPVCEHSVQIQLIDREVITVRHMRILTAASYNRNTACHCQRLLDMKIALFAVLADSSVIIDPVSDVGILLDLGDQDPLADRVECSGLDK